MYLLKGDIQLEKISLKVPLDSIENILGTVTSPSIVLTELIKNSIDSNADNIRIDINTESVRQLIITDDGDGLDFKEIKDLASIGMSNKKTNGNFFRKDGFFFTGSKGLGILSPFSISDSFVLETEKNNKRYRVIWHKGQSSFSCQEISAKNVKGTVIFLNDIDEEYLSILTDENELNKLRHISIKNYVISSLNKKNISFFINNKQYIDLVISHIDNLIDKFKGVVKFKYKSDNNILNFQYISDNNIIKKEEICIKLKNELSISNILENNYNLSKIIYKGEQCRYLGQSLEDFSGEIFVTESRKDAELLKFGAGVKIFVNQFAMYGYLDKENDWLNFSVYSMLRKNTRYKPHNVYGYIHFENLNENKSSLKISNERAYFIENGAFKKFQEIMKNIIANLIFNIDVAEKNNYFNANSFNLDSTKNINNNCELSRTQDAIEKTEIESQYSEIAGTKKASNNGLDSREKNKLKNNSNFSESSTGEHTSIVKIDKKPQFNFFSTSNIMKYPEKIEIGYDELINQLKTLEYKKHYLLFVIAFRAILEGIAKRYLNSRSINLCGDFGQNVKLMTEDILKIIKDSEIIKPQDRTYMENIFGGYHAFKNYFTSIGADFYYNGKQGIKATKLNSFIHSPRWMEIEEAENLANNVILPLHVISREIINRMIK